MFMTPYETLRMGLVCKHWKELSRQDSVWKSHLTNYPEPEPLSIKRHEYEIYFTNESMLKRYAPNVSYNILVLKRDKTPPKEPRTNYVIFKDKHLEIKRESFAWILDDLLHPQRHYRLCGVPPSKQKEGEPCCTEAVSKLVDVILPQYSSKCSISKEGYDNVHNQVTTIISQRVEEEAMTEAEVRVLVHHKLNEILEVH